MRILFILLACTSPFLFSCQKERDFANRTTTGNGTTSSDGLLVKNVQKTGSDSVVTVYAYNVNKKLISYKKTGVDQGNDVNSEYHIHRNASGIVTDYSVINPDLVAAGIDSITTIVHYSSSKYTSYVLTVNMPGFVLLDSSAFTYDAAGKIVGENLYESPAGTGSDYYLSGKISYSYSTAGNLSGFVIHDFDQSGTEVFTVTNSNITYDTKTNPIYLGNEAFALGRPEWASPNNILSEQLSDSNGPPDNQSVTINYTYNNNNKPLTSTATEVPDNTVINGTYFYQ